MIAVDTNVLVHAHREDSPHHEAARGALRSLIERDRPWAIPWPCVHEFLAIVTHPRIYRPPTDPALALEAVTALRDLPRVVLLAETPDHLSRLADLLGGAEVVGPKVHDARVAAICLAHGVTELWTADRDVSAFAALTTVNPLTAG